MKKSSNRYSNSTTCHIDVQGFFQCLYLSDVSSLVFRVLIVSRRDILLLLLLLSNTVAY